MRLIKLKILIFLNKVKFLIIKMDPNGNGIIEDEFLNFKMNAINATLMEKNVLKIAKMLKMGLE